MCESCGVPGRCFHTEHGNWKPQLVAAERLRLPCRRCVCRQQRYILISTDGYSSEQLHRHNSCRMYYQLWVYWSPTFWSTVSACGQCSFCNVVITSLLLSWFWFLHKWPGIGNFGHFYSVAFFVAIHSEANTFFYDSPATGFRMKWCFILSSILPT